MTRKSSSFLRQSSVGKLRGLAKKNFASVLRLALFFGSLPLFLVRNPGWTMTCQLEFDDDGKTVFLLLRKIFGKGECGNKRIYLSLR